MKRLFGAPTGSAYVGSTLGRPMSWGPREVGGAQARPERRFK
jgi:hypothetical protein